MSDDQATDALKRSYRQVTGNKYDISDYKSGNETSQGLAETHEQMSDVYVSGATSGEIKRQEGTFRIPAHLFDEETQE